MDKTFPPKIIFISGIILYVLAVLFSIQLATSTPWLGLEFEVTSPEDEIRVSYIHPDGPAATLNIQGEQIVAIHGAQSKVFLTRELLVGMPYNFNTYTGFNLFFEMQTSVADILNESKVALETSAATLFDINPVLSRPISSLPAIFWLQLLIGGGVFFVSLSVLAYGQDDAGIVNKCFVLAGISFLVLATIVSVYTNRELAIDGQFFYSLAMIQYYASLTFVAFFVSIFCFYPMQIKQYRLLMTSLAGLCVLSLLHVFQIFDSLTISVYLLFYLIAGLGIFFIILQYNYTRGFIVERASLRWLVYALITGDVLFFIISIIPLLTSLELVHKQFFYWFALLCVYIGIALGIKKYKLFKLELWALYSWIWMFGGLIVLGLAVILILIFNISSVVALLFSVLVVGWLYFPLRHWLWENYAFGFNRTQYQERLPELLEIILSPKSVRSNKEQWEFLLRQVFDPVLVMNDIDDSEEVEIKESGAVMHVPEFEDIPAIGLAGVERGSRLFNENDVRFLNSLMTLFQNAQVFKSAYERGVHEERTRIARDLHDDVAARLLTLIHKTEGTPQEPLAREALVTLRESINSLGGRKEQSLDDLLRELQVDIKFRLEAADIQFSWEQDRRLYKKTLSSRQATNFKRVSQEIITNILKHANADVVRIDSHYIDSMFVFSICDDGDTKLMKDWVNGRGVNNIRTRIKESGGSVRWSQRIIDTELAGTCVEVSIPV